MFRSLMGSSSAIYIKVTFHKRELAVCKGYMLKRYTKVQKDDELRCGRFCNGSLVYCVLAIAYLWAEG
jgi:hypothetical protein